MKKIASLIVFIFICTQAVADSWTSTGSLDATSIGGSGTTLETAISKKLNIPSYLQTVDTRLTATDTSQVEFTSSSYLTRDVGGITRTSGTEVSQRLLLQDVAPGESSFDVDLYQSHSLDWSDINNPQKNVDTKVVIDDPAFDMEDLMELEISPDDTPLQVMAEMLESFGEDENGELITDIGALQALGYSINRMDLETESSNGITCTWGTGRGLAVGRRG